MNIEDSTIKEARELAAMFGGSHTSPNRDFGLSILVADRGFVYVGYVTRKGDDFEISRCRNIRYWGTDKGLAQLVNDGPTSNSKIDEEMKLVVLPARAVISVHPVEVKSWKKLF